jgi:tetratricopeptide (TPR) repeat protein
LPIYKRALELDPKHAPARLQYARDLFYTGHADEAAKQFRRMIAAGQDLASAWYGLAEIKTFAFDADDLAALKKLRKNPRFAGLERATLLHAVGKAFEDAGDFAAAFDAFTEAARIERTQFPVDRADFDAYIRAIRAAFPQRVSTAGEQGSEVIFIIGMPRAGSTLIEQILATHSQVEGASELPDLTLTIDRESQRRGRFFPQWVIGTSEADWLRIGTDYLDATSRWRTTKPRFTDKSPGNWMLAEAAIAMLPKARFINVRRDPLETCWSCFRQFFAPGSMPWASSFDDIADYLHCCHAHCDYLAERYPDNVRIQSFEALVDDPEGQIRELLAFCGLDFETACLNFHEAARTIRTASAAQVRRPMSRPPSNAERYGALLDPLREALRRTS